MPMCVNIYHEYKELLILPEGSTFHELEEAKIRCSNVFGGIFVTDVKLEYAISSEFNEYSLNKVFKSAGYCGQY